MQELINSSYLVNALVERIYAEKYASKDFDLLDVQAFWTDALVNFGDVVRAESIALLATTQLNSVEKSFIRQQLPAAMRTRIDNLTGNEQWPLPKNVSASPADLETEKVTLVEKLDNEAEAQRLLYITKGSGKAMVYQQKLTEALIVLGGGTNGYLLEDVPHIVNEAAVNGITLEQQAEIIHNAFVLWRFISSVIEAKLMAAKAAVKAAETIEAARAAAIVDWSVE